MQPSDWRLVVLAAQNVLLLVEAVATVYLLFVVPRRLRGLRAGFQAILDAQAEAHAKLQATLKRVERETGVL